MHHKLLIVEDDPDIVQLARIHLEDAQFIVESANNGRKGLELASSGLFDLIILDLMLPGMDGLEVCRRLRGLDIYTPILMLTAKSSELDRILGLDQGADDYLTKPFSILELVARVKAMIRRSQYLKTGIADDRTEIIVVGDFCIDTGQRTVCLKEKDLTLTAREFDLLVHFARHPGRVYSRSQLLDAVWGYQHDTYEHTVNSHINRLRSKIEEYPAKPRYIITVRGVGYKFSATELKEGL